MNSLGRPLCLTAIIVFLCLLVAAPVVFAQEAAAAPPASQPSPDVEPASYETSLMILVATGILLAGLLITRLLMRLGVIKRFVWVMPIYVLLTGAVWIQMYLVQRQDLQKLHGLSHFLFAFSLLVCVLYVVGKLAIPSEARRTRGGLPILLRGVAIVFFATIGMFVLLAWAFPDFNLGPLFVTSGVVSIVVGLALQNLLGNLVAGVVLGIQRPFKIGDWIRVGDVLGEVTSINWRATLIRTRQNDIIFVPNYQLAQEQMVNYDRPSSAHLEVMHVGVTYDTPPGLAVKALMEAAARAEGVLRRPSPQVHFREYQDSSLLYELRCWIDNYTSQPEISSDLHREVWYAFKRHGITIPFPIRDVNLRQVAEPPQEERGRLVAASGLPRGVVYSVGSEPLTIGRDEKNDIVLADPHVSGNHAVVERTDTGFCIRDLDSRSGTSVNGVAVKTAVLNRGDEIAIGPIRLVYESDSQPVADMERERERLAQAPEAQPTPGTKPQGASDTVFLEPPKPSE